MRAIGLASLALLVIAAGCGSGGTSAAPDCGEKAGSTSSGGESLASELLGAVPCWVEREQLPAEARPGARLFATAGCTSCHTYLGVGSRTFGAPDLSAVGARVDDVPRYERLLVHPPPPMPSFASLGPKRIHRLAVFLAASKGAG